MRCTTRLVLPALAVLALGAGAAGCGKDGNIGGASDRAPAAAPALAPSDPATTAAALPTGLGTDERAAATIVLKYARSIGEGNYARACASRVREERERFARRSGTCERALLLNFRGRPRELFATIEVGAVRIRGDLAGVDLRQPGGGAAELTLAARRVRDRWRVEDVADAQVP